MEEVGQNENEVHSQQEVDKVGNDLDSGRAHIVSLELIIIMRSMKA